MKLPLFALLLCALPVLPACHGTPAATPHAKAVAGHPGVCALSLVFPKDYQVFQRQSLSGGVARVSGRCGVACDAVQARLSGRDYAGQAYDSGWQTLAVDPATTGFNANLNVPAGGWYALDVRAVDGGKTVAAQSVAHVGMGEVFVGAGQSNSTSCGGLGSNNPLDGRTEPVSGMVSTFDGASWRIAKDPQPGAHDQGQYTFGSFWPAFGDAINAKYHVPVGVAVTGHGGTSINQWKPGGELFNWTLTRLRELGPGGFRAVLWHQGESDAGGMSEQAYAAGLGDIIGAFRAQAGWDFPFMVAQATFRPGAGNSAAVRAAQKRLWDEQTALPGPDTDAMLGDLRDHGGKGIHFSRKGLKVHGEAWAAKVGEYLDRVLGK